MRHHHLGVDVVICGWTQGVIIAREVLSSLWGWSWYFAVKLL